MLRLTGLFVLATHVEFSSGHGAITWPPTRYQSSMKTAGLCIGADPFVPMQTGTCFWWTQCCTIGCGSCTGGSREPNSSAAFPIRCCDTPAEPTLPDQYRTWNNFPSLAQDGDITKYTYARARSHKRTRNAQLHAHAPCHAIMHMRWKVQSLAQPRSQTTFGFTVLPTHAIRLATAHRRCGTPACAATCKHATGRAPVESPCGLAGGWYDHTTIILPSASFFLKKKPRRMPTANAEDPRRLEGT